MATTAGGGGGNLREAAHRGDLPAIRTLLAAGAKVNDLSQDRRAMTALSAASSMGHLEVVRELIHQHGADVKVVDRGNWTALQYACTRNSPPNTEIVRELLKAGADVSARTRLGGTSLQLASREGCVETMILLIQAKADVNACNNDGSSALHLAAESGHCAAIEELIRCGANVNARDAKGNTALHLAVENGHVEVVSLLQRHGADVALMRSDGKIAADLASSNAKIGELFKTS